MNVFECLTTMLLAINCVWLSYSISKLNSRINNLEHMLSMKEWLDGINSGESPSDMNHIFPK